MPERQARFVDRLTHTAEQVWKRLQGYPSPEEQSKIVRILTQGPTEQDLDTYRKRCRLLIDFATAFSRPPLSLEPDNNYYAVLALKEQLENATPDELRQDIIADNLKKARRWHLPIPPSDEAPQSSQSTTLNIPPCPPCFRYHSGPF